MQSSLCSMFQSSGPLSACTPHAPSPSATSAWCNGSMPVYEAVGAGSTPAVDIAIFALGAHQPARTTRPCRKVWPRPGFAFLKFGSTVHHQFRHRSRELPAVDHHGAWHLSQFGVRTQPPSMPVSHVPRRHHSGDHRASAEVLQIEVRQRRWHAWLDMCSKLC